MSMPPLSSALRRAASRHGLPLLTALAVLLALVAGWARPARAATAVINVCAQTDTTGWGLLGYHMSNMLQKLDNPANFGPAGTYGDFDFNYIDLGSTITEAGILANSCNIYFSGFEPDTNYTASELTELSNWIANNNAHR